MNVLHWFRNDLRIHDHRILGKLKNEFQFLPVYIIDPRQFKRTKYGFTKTGFLRYQFLIDTLKNLDQKLRLLGSRLIVKTGNPGEELAKLTRECDIDLITYQKEYAWEEIQQETELQNLTKVKTSAFHGKTLYHPEDIPFEISKIPNVFTGFRKKCEKYAQVRELYPIPKRLPSLPENTPNSEPFPEPEKLRLKVQEISNKTAFPFQGGEEEALERLNDYIFERELIKSYKYTRNQLVGEAFSSKFSPWLANGSLSPRKIYWSVMQYENENKSSISTYWLIFELIWRDFFQYITMKHGRKIFYKSGIKNNRHDYENDINKYEKWIAGKTGEPFVDANMIELKETGWMSNRGRQNVASYLCKDLNVDWRWGAAWFESQLIDYDVSSNWGNWMYVAGTGNDPRENRYFNVKKQAEKYDPQSKFVNLWLNEV